MQSSTGPLWESGDIASDLVYENPEGLVVAIGLELTIGGQLHEFLVVLFGGLPAVAWGNCHPSLDRSEHGT